MSNAGIAITTLSFLLLTLLLVFIRLDTIIRQDGVYYRFFPFQWTYRQLTWDRVSNAYARRYKPIQEYGGWGIRFGIAESGTAYTISGKQGLQLVFDKGKRLLIGTQKPDEVEKVLKQLGKLTSSSL